VQMKPVCGEKEAMNGDEAEGKVEDSGWVLSQLGLYLGKGNTREEAGIGPFQHICPSCSRLSFQVVTGAFTRVLRALPVPCL
jgi:hypothetical protein